MMKAPNSNIQEPEKLQAANFNDGAIANFGAWDLEFLWSLPVFTSFQRGRAEAESEGGEVGAWSFFYK